MTVSLPGRDAARRRGASRGPRRANVLPLLMAGALGLLSAPALVSEPAPGALEGDPFRGRTLFVEKLCSQCHSVWGHGGTVGPEITRVIAGKPLLQLTGEFWNHTPRMMDEIQGKGYAWPTLDRAEMASLLTYLYYVRLFDEPGNATRGAATYARLHCESCHTLGPTATSVGGRLDRFWAYTSPVPLAQAMWNAGAAMRRAQSGQGTPMPQFSGSEMADIQAFIHERGQPSDEGRVVLLPLPDPVAGKAVFEAKRCASCHASPQGAGPSLGEAAMRMTVAEISGVLWNHSYAMQDRMTGAGIPVPRFEGNELVDVIGYLHLMGFAGRVGDADRGATVFRTRGCATCHQGQDSKAPDLAGSESSFEAISLSAAMWNHAPQMRQVMAQRRVAWPRFGGTDVEDLAAYLKRLAHK
jgi:cytochrome c2